MISGGTNAGVMKHVGDALQGSANACIGIATWGVISKREKLNPATASTSESSSGQAGKDGNTYTYEVGSWLTEKGAFLDSNHSHFLLVDNGTENQYGVEIPFRGQLEKYIMAKAVGSNISIDLFIEKVEEKPRHLCPYTFPVKTRIQKPHFEQRARTHRCTCRGGRTRARLRAGSRDRKHTHGRAHVVGTGRHTRISEEMCISIFNAGNEVT